MSVFLFFFFFSSRRRHTRWLVVTGVQTCALPISLARLLDALRQRGDVRVDTFGAFLARYPPQEDVRLVAPSAWSCPHGVERWRSDCGCRVHGDRATHQRWRAPLRNALDWLAAELHRVFGQEGSTIFAADPWTVRDVYGSV